MHKDVVLIVDAVTPGGFVYGLDVAEVILQQANAILSSGQALPGRLSPDEDLGVLKPEYATHIVRSCWAERSKDGQIERLWIGYEPTHGPLGQMLRKVMTKKSHYFAPRGIAKLQEGSTIVSAEGYELITFDCHIAGIRDR